MLELRQKMPEPPGGYSWMVELKGHGHGSVVLLNDYDDELREDFDYSIIYAYPTAESVVLAAGRLIQRVLCGREVERLTDVPVHVY